MTIDFNTESVGHLVSTYVDEISGLVDVVDGVNGKMKRQRVVGRYTQLLNKHEPLQACFSPMISKTYSGREECILKL